MMNDILIPLLARELSYNGMIPAEYWERWLFSTISKPEVHVGLAVRGCFFEHGTWKSPSANKGRARRKGPLS
jgi:hypothetical protein